MNGYDTLGRVITESHNDVLKFRYFYNAEGALTKKLDISTGKAVNYEYDSLGRLIHSWQLDENGAIVQKTEHIFDTENRTSSQKWQFGNQTYTESYNYDTDDGALTTMTTAAGNTLSFSYDNLKRLSTRSNNIYSQGLSYRDINSTHTTTQVSQVRYSQDGSNALSPMTLGYGKLLLPLVFLLHLRQLL